MRHNGPMTKPHMSGAERQRNYVARQRALDAPAMLAKLAERFSRYPFFRVSIVTDLEKPEGLLIRMDYEAIDAEQATRRR